jgi:beta-N-acetylhexosaminidase
MNRKALIVGIKGTELSIYETLFLKKQKPWGLILFSRNIKNLLQLKKLIDNIRCIFKDKKYPILIDQEGGKVSRLNKIIDLTIFSQGFFADLYKKDKEFFYVNFKIYMDLICKIMNQVGININTVPVLDVLRKNSHNIIGDRSFSSDPDLVSKMGNIYIKSFSKRKIATVTKHIPGHGLSKSDSHFKLESTSIDKNKLINNDFKPFSRCKSLFSMTAHIIYKAYDPHFTATQSKIIINNVIRKKIGFKGILISDDISMKSLKYGLANNAVKALDAGCNLVLHCNGNIKEMWKLSKVIPNIDIFTQKKTSQFYKFLG